VAVTRQNRAMVVVCNLQTFGDPKLKWLYSFAESSGVVLATLFLKPHYKRFRTLTGPDASKAGFLTTLESLGRRDEVKAIDVILMLHGELGTLCFADGGSVPTGDLESEIGALGIGDKLRLLYSLACYGESHADNFCRAGFATACGAAKVNANGGTEYPIVLPTWAAGGDFQSGIALGDHPATRAACDAAAVLIGFSNVDSQKAIRGRPTIRITSSAS
jgi:hypothetical protein